MDRMVEYLEGDIRAVMRLLPRAKVVLATEPDLFDDADIAEATDYVHAMILEQRADQLMHAHAVSDGDVEHLTAWMRKEARRMRIEAENLRAAALGV